MESRTSKPDLFISYPHSEVEQAVLIKDMAEGLGLKVFMDVGIGFGERWDDALRDALESCQLFFVLVNDPDLTRWMHIELGAAWLARKPMRVLLIDPTRGGLKDLPLPLLETQVETIDSAERLLGQAAHYLLHEGDRLRIQRLADSTDLTFDFSAQTFALIPPRYRDRFTKVSEWLSESLSSPDLEPQELYYVASYDGEVVGLLYVSLFLQHARAFINCLVVRDDRQSRGGVTVARALYDACRADVLDRSPECPGLLLERPKPRPGDRRSAGEQGRVNRVVEALGLEGEQRARRFDEVDYMIPPAEGFQETQADPADLLLLPLRPPKQWTTRSAFIRDWLAFVYSTHYGAAFEAGTHDTYRALVSELALGVASSLPERIYLTDV